VDTINRDSYTDVRARIRSQIYNRILKKPNPESYEIVSSVSGTAKSFGGGISAPDKIKELLGINKEEKKEAESRGSGENESGRKNNGEPSSTTKSLMVQDFHSGDSPGIQKPGPGEREPFINLSTLAKVIGVDRKKLQKSIFQYSMVFGEGLYDMDSNQYRIPLSVASILFLGKKMVEGGRAKSYQDAFNKIKGAGIESFGKEIEPIKEAIIRYLREVRGEALTEVEEENKQEEKEAFAEALLEVSSSIWVRVAEIENSILEFHYAFLKIKQEIESVKEDIGKFEKMIVEYLGRKEGRSWRTPHGLWRGTIL
jgi:hypothetical protein